LALVSTTAAAVTLDGNLTQGGLVIGRAIPGSSVALDGRAVRVAPDGLFVLGFHRDAGPTAELVVTAPDGVSERRSLAIVPRHFDIQRIDGLPPRMVTPPPEVLARIKHENARIAALREDDRPEPLFRSGFAWPATGRISGVYGSQRILNGEARQ